MWKLSALIIVIVLLLTLAIPVFAFEPPGQDTTANATDTIIWHGDTANISITSGNFDIDSATLTIEDLETAMTAAGETAGAAISGSIDTAVDDIMEFAVMLVIMLGLAGLAYWRGDKPLFLIAGLAFMIYGFSFSSISIYYSILLVLAGFFLCARAFTERGMDKWQR